MPTERVSASGKNLRFSVAGQLMMVIFNFYTRKMFIGILGAEYTGFSSLCGHVLGFLSLIEPGFDAACIYCLYKPLAYNDRVSVRAVMSYIKKIYRRIGILTFAAGLVLLPFILHFSSDAVDLKFASSVYLLMLGDMSLTYFFSHRCILPPADQKSYVNSCFGSVSFIISRMIQLFVLAKTGSYIVYLASGMVCGFIGEVLLYIKVGKMYPYINKTTNTISPELVKSVNSKAMSLFFRKCGAVLCGSADNMAVFAFIGLYGGTMYSNYTMLSGICLTFIAVIISSAQGGVGNLGVTGSKERMLKIYTTTLFAISLVSGVFALSLFFTYPLIISMWLGEAMVLDSGCSALFCLCMYVSAIRRPTCVFLDAMGLFEKEKAKTMIEAAIMISATLILTPHLGIKGVLLGQLTASVLFSLPFEAHILFRHGFRESVVIYVKDIAKYLSAFALSFVLSLTLCLCTSDIAVGIPLILTRILICSLSSLSVFFILFFDSGRMAETVRYAGRMIGGRR